MTANYSHAGEEKEYDRREADYDSPCYDPGYDAVLLLCPGLCWLSMADTAVAGGAPGATGAAESANDSSLTDFNHALAVQATPDQTSQFKEVSQEHGGRKEAGAGPRAIERRSADSRPTLSQRTAALKSAVEDAQGGSQDFVKSFSKSQKAGLKELAKKLEKADSEVGKQWKALEQQLGRTKSDGKAIAEYGGQAGKSAGGIPEPAAQSG